MLIQIIRYGELRNAGHTDQIFLKTIDQETDEEIVKYKIIDQ